VYSEELSNLAIIFIFLQALSTIPLFLFVIIVSYCFQDMSYDLGDAAKWEFLFPTLDKPLLGLPAMDEGNLDLDEEEVRLTYVPAERLGF
jgi:hypothetical protein